MAAAIPAAIAMATSAASAVTISGVASAVSIGTGIMGAVSALNQGSASASSAYYNSQNAKQNALLSRRAGEVDAHNIRRSGREILGKEQAGYAASGVSQDGSATDVRMATAAAIETDALTARYNAELKAIGYDNTAALDKAAGKNATTASIYGAASALLGIVPGAAKLAGVK